jgi:hypothetical protein
VTRARTVAERALAAMREARELEPSELASGAPRRRMVARLEGFHARVLRENPRRMSWLAGSVALVAAVAIAFGAVLAQRSSIATRAVDVKVSPAKLVAGHGAVEFATTHPARSTSRAELFPGDLLETPADGAATLVLALGTHVELDENTRIELLTPGAPAGKSESVRLVTGRIELSVPKQPDGASFSVIAPLAKVIVLGTRFSVTAREHGPTTVDVTEGRVLVEHGSGSTFLNAGMVWVSSNPFEPSALAPSSAASSSASPVAGVSAANGSESATVVAPPAGRSSSKALGSASASSSLAAQNELLMAALKARRSGNDRAALVELDALLERYPHSAASDEASVERFRALARLGHREQARAAARRYLAQHPNGFAADEARGLALEVSTPQQDGGP